jgi:hypothetical protein
MKHLKRPLSVVICLTLPIFFLYKIDHSIANSGYRFFIYIFFLQLLMLIFPAFFKKVPVGRGKTIGLSIVLALIFLFKPETIYYFIVLGGVGFWLIEKVNRKMWLIGFGVLLLVFAQFKIQKALIFSNVESMMASAHFNYFSNLQFPNKVGRPAGPELARTGFYGPKMDAKEYLFKHHTRDELFLFTISGYMNYLITGKGSLFNFDPSELSLKSVFNFAIVVLFLLAIVSGASRIGGLVVIWMIVSVIPFVFLHRYDIVHRLGAHCWYIFWFLLILFLEQKEKGHKTSRRVNLICYGICLCVLVYPIQFNSLYNYNLVKQLNYNSNSVRSDQFQKYYVLNGGGGQLEKERGVWVPAGQGHLRFDFKVAPRPGHAIELDFLGKSKTITTRKSGTRYCVSFQTEKVLESAVGLKFDSKAKLYMNAVTISSRPSFHNYTCLPL